MNTATWADVVRVGGIPILVMFTLFLVFRPAENALKGKAEASDNLPGILGWGCFTILAGVAWYVVAGAIALGLYVYLRGEPVNKNKIIIIILIWGAVWFYLQAPASSTSGQVEQPSANYARCGDPGPANSVQRVVWGLCASWEASK